MTLRRICTTTAVVFVSLLLTATTGCGHNTVELLAVDGGGIVLHPKAGDVISWSTGAAGKQVTFFNGMLCTEGAKTDKCTISAKAPTGTYTYQCDGCADPAIVYGDATLHGSIYKPTDQIALTAGPPGTHYSTVYCNGNTAAAQDVKAGPSDTVRWSINPGTMPDGWKVKFPSTTVCRESDSFDQDHHVCTLNNLSSDSYTYTVHAEACPGSDGQGKITIP